MNNCERLSESLTRTATGSYPLQSCAMSVFQYLLIFVRLFLCICVFVYFYISIFLKLSGDDNDGDAVDL